MPRHFGNRERQLIVNLKDYFRRERDNKGPLLPLHAVNERVANALQISMATVHAVGKMQKAGESNETKKAGPKDKNKCNLDESKIGDVRNIIFDMIKNKEQITLKSMNKKLRDKGVFDGSDSSFRHIIQQIGFKLCSEGLVELPNIAMLRTNFLVSYTKEKTSEIRRQMVYVDETLWVMENGTGKCLWQGSRHKRVPIIKNEGKRYVVFHAGNEHGFLPGAALVISSKNKNPNHRPEINDQNFIRWFEEQVLQKLERPSVIIMSDASYRSSLSKNYPNSNWNKSDIKNWLQERLIFYHNNLLKVQLLEVAKRNLPPKKYEVEELATKYGHEVLRVPPFHGIFNPIEMIWGIVKNYYNDNVEKDGGLAKAMTVFEEALTTASPAAWQNSIKYTETVIKKWWEREVYFDQQDIVPAVISLGQESESEGSDLDSECESDYEAPPPVPKVVQFRPIAKATKGSAKKTAVAPPMPMVCQYVRVVNLPSVMALPIKRKK